MPYPHILTKIDKDWTRVIHADSLAEYKLKHFQNIGAIKSLQIV